jgi:hypothetical protein
MEFFDGWLHPMIVNEKNNGDAFILHEKEFHCLCISLYEQFITSGSCTSVIWIVYENWWMWMTSPPLNEKDFQTNGLNIV